MKFINGKSYSFMLGNPLKVSSYISVILLELKSKEVSIKISLKESTSIDVILFSQKDNSSEFCKPSNIALLIKVSSYVSNIET
jgi:hypothetical protein